MGVTCPFDHEVKKGLGMLSTSSIGAWWVYCKDCGASGPTAVSMAAALDKFKSTRLSANKGGSTSAT